MKDQKIFYKRVFNNEYKEKRISERCGYNNIIIFGCDCLASYTGREIIKNRTKLLREHKLL